MYLNTAQPRGYPSKHKVEVKGNALKQKIEA